MTVAEQMKNRSWKIEQKLDSIFKNSVFSILIKIVYLFRRPERAPNIKLIL